MANNNYKRIVAALLAAGLMGSPLVQAPYNTAYAAESAITNDIGIIINGKLLSSENSGFISNGRTLVPLRVIMESLGAEVEWDSVNRAVLINKNGKNVKLYIDNRLVSYNENGVDTYDVCDVAPIIKDNLTYVPIRLVSNALGLDVEWNNELRQVSVLNTENVQPMKFFDIDISNVENGQALNGPVQFTLTTPTQLPQNAYQIKYLFLDPVTGMGKIVARTTDLSSPASFIPDINNQGSGILAAVVCDKAGNFISGTAKAVTIAVTPSVTLNGLSDGQSVTDAVKLSTELNFMPSSMVYEFTDASGNTTQSAEVDPYDSYTFVPTANQNGAVSVRAAALDSEGNKYYSQSVNINVNVAVVPVENYITLKAINTDNVGKVPVKLSIDRNFNVNKTGYYAKNTSTGKIVTLYENGWGDYSWFPGPDMAGTWEIYVQCVGTDGKTYTSNSRTVTVPSSQSLILSGIGPNQVITGEFSISSISNVDVTSISYILSNPYNGSSITLGTTSNASDKVSYTPNPVNEGKRNIQAVATLKDGSTIKSDVVSINFYLGKIYSSQPIVKKDQFIDFAASMAVETQKENGMSAALQIAQALLESGWGQSVPVDKYTGLLSNNLFGIKGTGNAGSVTCSTWEEYYGTTYRIDANFRAYHTPIDSWNDHNDLLLRLDRYKPYTNVMYNSTAGAYALRRCGYATDSKYPGKLINIIKLYDLDKYDQQKL